MGARTSLSEGYIEASADRLSGAAGHLRHEEPSQNGNLMMAASLAEGTTVLSNAALEPEVCDLARLLRAMGPTSRGRERRGRGPGGPVPSTGRHEVMADRIEAATLLLAGAITGGDVTALGADIPSMNAVVEKAQEKRGRRGPPSRAGCASAGRGRSAP